jgi:two-component system NtrC family sensor kinase
MPAARKPTKKSKSQKRSQKIKMGRASALNRESQRVDQLKALLDVVERAKYVWESTFDAFINPVMIVDNDYQIQRANVSMAQSVGKDVRQLIGNRCYEVFAGRTRPCKGCPLEVSWNLKQPISSRVEKFEDGREYQGLSFPLKGKKADLDLSIVQYRDIREERHLQSRLIQSEKMAAIGLLAGGIAHEINNPLSGILAFAQLALTQLEEDSQVYQDIKEIETSAIRCKRIVENLLEFSRQSSFEEKDELDLRSVIERVLPLLKLQIKEAGVSLETEFIEPFPKVIANGNQLEQVFLNLTSNACHALSRGGKITLKTVLQDSDWLRIDFADNGSGIKKEFLPKIFDPFFTTKSAGMGTGLGLSIIYSIIQDHGGRIEVESSENKGTIFRIFLPTSVSAKDQVFYQPLQMGR